MHVPAREFTVLVDLADTLFVALSKELHSHHGKDENDNGQYQGQVAQGTHWISNNLDQHVQGGPGFGQLEDSELWGKKKPQQNPSETQFIYSYHMATIKTYEITKIILTFIEHPWEIPRTF